VAAYQAQFQRVFGTGVTADGVAKAIAAFQRTLLSGNSAYDRHRAAMRPAFPRRRAAASRSSKARRPA
jgi:cytochrome c peroxidase